MDVNLNVPAIEKLLDYTASGIGSVAGPMLAPWKARKDVEAKLIATRAQVEMQQLLADSQASSLRVLAKAQADARAMLATTETRIQGELSIADTVTQRVQFQEEKKQRNIGAVVGQAALELGDIRVRDHEPDHDWTARFFTDVQDVSSEEMQVLWARVLAGEVKKPGSASIKTLSILKSLDRSTAALFRRLCSMCVSVRPDGVSFMDARVPSLGGNPGHNALQEYGLDFGKLNILNEHGLIIADYNSWHDYQLAIGFAMPDQIGGRFQMPFCFEGRYWVLMPTSQRDIDKNFTLSGVALTHSGQELSRVVDLEPKEKYAQALKDYFRSANLEMIEVESWHTRQV